MENKYTTQDIEEIVGERERMIGELRDAYEGLMISQNALITEIEELKDNIKSLRIINNDFEKLNEEAMNDYSEHITHLRQLISDYCRMVLNSYKIINNEKDYQNIMYSLQVEANKILDHLIH